MVALLSCLRKIIDHWCIVVYTSSTSTDCRDIGCREMSGYVNALFAVNAEGSRNFKVLMLPK